jgi:hypothetical protein
MIRVMLIVLLLCKSVYAEDPLEDLVRIKPNDLLEMKIQRVLKARKVVRPDYYAKLIAHSTYTVQEKKMAVALLVPESRGDARAVNYNRTCFGPWQVNKGWKKKLGIKGSLFDPPVCLDAAIKVWNIHLNDAKGSRQRAIAAYSGGAKGYVAKIENILRSLA